MPSPQRSELARAAHRAQTHATPRASAGKCSSASGAIFTPKHQQCVAFGSAAIAQAFASPQSGQRAGSTEASLAVFMLPRGR